MQFNSQDLIHLFNSLFKTTERTILIGGAAEPLYLPKNADRLYHKIIFTHDYFASALHEIAHWCIAGEERRKLIDYGYWYKPDGRSAAEQHLFEQAEIKPQALEWIFSVAAGKTFRVSADNLSGNATCSEVFKTNIYKQVIIYLEHGLPRRAQQFKNALLNFYDRNDEFNYTHFNHALI